MYMFLQVLKHKKIYRKFKTFAEKSAQYIDEGKYDEAYGTAQRLYELGSAVNCFSLLVKYFVVLVRTDRIDKAYEIRNEFFSLSQNAELSAEDVMTYADQLRVRSKCFESLLFYDLAATLIVNETQPEEAINSFLKCVVGWSGLVRDLLEKHLVRKSFVKTRVVSQMSDSYKRVKGLAGLDKKQSCLVLAIILHCIDQAYWLLGEIKAREETGETAVQMMRDVFGEEASKFQIYSTILNNLGHAYMIQGRTDEAIRLFTEAIAALKKAIDYSSEAERKRDMEKAEIALRILKSEI
ncbi:unnamed protein product [Clavelina lepadiformis]|uniref:Tetratricopeptide repeat protein n=1 Tax=Clavelina lepadiformis TaxID=159417 RepID=A0ABP0GC56_CLALP